MKKLRIHIMNNRHQAQGKGRPHQLIRAKAQIGPCQEGCRRGQAQEAKEQHLWPHKSPEPLWIGTVTRFTAVGIDKFIGF